MKKIILYSLLLALSSCDKSMPTEINAGKVYEVFTTCGTIEFRATYFTGSMTIAQKFSGRDYVVNFKDLRLKTYPEDVLTIDNVEFKDGNGKTISVDSLAINNNQSLIVTVFVKMKKESTSDKYISILPCNYILCNKRPVIMDTINVKY